MKKLIMAILLALPFVAMSQAKSSVYTAGYSSKFTMADPSYSDKVLTLWKDYENNTLDKDIDLISDTVTMILQQGAVVKGKAENLKGVKEFRNSIKDYKVVVEAWMSIKSDRNENIVLVWGNENFTDKDGKNVQQRVHEVWVFNKAGKISLMMQYAGGGHM
ncbi:MAG: nuclear transport factor 2 family protein [Mucilaginibacter sp.]|nr:nuclear transport factor 2 family protein [Mucilaginibacter sp.]